MRRVPAPAVRVLRPILDMYMDSAVALSGCHTQGIERHSCELDVVIVGTESRPSTSAKIGGVYMDLIFITESDALKPADPEHSASMARAHPVRDASLVISTGTSAAAAVIADSCRRSTRGRLASALKSLGRVDEALSNGSLKEADFWLTAASYDYAYALLYSREVVPAPSHLLGQLRGQSKGALKGFQAFSTGAALERSARNTCGSRLEGIGVLHDVLRGRQRTRAEESAGWAPARLEIVKAKSQDLAARVEHAEGYSFLGQEMVDAMLELADPGGRDGGREGGRRSDVGSLFQGKEQLLGDRLLSELGLVREGPALRASLGAVKEQVSSLARRV